MKILGDLDISSFVKAVDSLGAALKRASLDESDDMLRDACIQRFEFTFELAWKSLKRILSYRGVEVNSPRQTFRYAAKEGLISDPEHWFVFLEKRNLTTHTYNQSSANEIYRSLDDFYVEVENLLRRMKSL